MAANMAVQSRAEINLRRLLVQCETMASEMKSNDGRINWRLEKVGNLELQFHEMCDTTCKRI